MTTTTTTFVVHLHGVKASMLPVGLILKVFAAMFAVGLVMVAIGAMFHRKQTKGDLQAPGLYGVVGRMGGGKSYFLALACFDAVASGRPVYANFAVDGGLRYRNWQEVLEIPHCADEGCKLGARTCKDNRGPMLVMDEVHLWFPSHAWRCPDEVTGLLSQLRKLKVTMLWASQHEAHVGKKLIRLSFAFWKCEHYKRGHRYTLYDAVGFGTAKQEKLARMNVLRKSAVMASYDTHEIVQTSVEWGDSGGTGKAPSSISARTDAAPGIPEPARGPDDAPVGRHVRREPVGAP